jgi:phosphoribosyl 1,2-cyclic phosphodiesterase
VDTIVKIRLIAYYREVNIVMVKNDSSDIITFLGTAGARFMVIRQLAASGGIWLSLHGTEILVDPGPGCIVQANKRKLNAEKLSAIVVSHRHLDHAADVNVMVEAMTNGGFNHHGRLLAPADAFEPESIIFNYLRKFIEGITVLEECGSYQIGNVTLETPVRHQHPVETYGMVFRTPEHSFSYLADTNYFPGLSQHYKNDAVIINMVLTQPRPPIQHLSIPDVERIINEIKPKVTILNHFGLHVWQEKPWKIADSLSQKTGLRVIAARDGMKFDLAQLNETNKGNGKNE